MSAIIADLVLAALACLCVYGVIDPNGAIEIITLAGRCLMRLG